MNRAAKKITLIVVLLAISAGYQYFQGETTPSEHSASNTNTHSSPSSNSKSPATDNKQATLDKIRKAADSQKSGWWLATSGKVIKVLKDDTKGHQHQKFLLKLAPDVTLLVAHNIDLAPRVPLRKGDSIKIRGRYEWNNRGGVLHWTHHDPKGRKKDGWIYHNGKYYK